MSVLKFTFHGNKVKVDPIPYVQTLSGFTDSDILKTIMVLEAMFIAQTGINRKEMRDILDEEVQHIEASDDTSSFGIDEFLNGKKKEKK